VSHLHTAKSSASPDCGRTCRRIDDVSASIKYDLNRQSERPSSSAAGPAPVRHDRRKTSAGQRASECVALLAVKHRQCAEILVDVGVTQRCICFPMSGYL
jgi:hypothetical protein